MDKNIKKTILITGGAGFIGSSACQYYVDKQFTVIACDNLSTGFLENIDSLIQADKIKFYQLDICNKNDLENVFNENRIDYCLNFAAQISVAESVLNPSLTFEININGLSNLLELCGRYKVKKVVHASSAAIYGENEVLPKNELLLPEPKSPYAISKITGEYLNLYYSSQYGFDAINCRFFNVFGEKQNPDSSYAAAMPIFIRKAVLNKDIVIYGDGNQTRDFIYVFDLISAIDHLLDQQYLKHHTYNIGYGNFISIIKLAEKIIKHTDSKSNIFYESSRPGDIKYSYASICNLINTGWTSKYGFDTGLDNTISWLKSCKL